MHRLHAFVVTALIVALGFGRPALSAQVADGVVLPLPPKDQQEITAQLGEGVVGAPLPSVAISDLAAFFPLQDRSATFVVTAGKHKGEQQVLSLSKRTRPVSGKVAWRYALSPSLATFMLESETGLVMPSIADSGHDVVVVTTPANPFLIQGMQPGESRKLSQTVSVHYLDNPQRQEYSGSLEGTYTYVGTYQVSVPAGTFPAVLMRLEFAGKVGPAHTQDTEYYLFAPNVGVVAMINQEDVEAFWVINIDTTSGKVLASQ